MKIVQIAIGGKYFEEAKVSIASIRRFFDGEIYLVTDQPSDNIYPSLKATLIPVGSCSAQESTILKMQLPEMFDEADTLLYLDTDIICTKPITIPPVSDKVQVYGYPNRTQSEPSFAGYIEKKVDFNSHPGINTGIMHYQINQDTRQLFDQAKNLYNSELKINHINACWEQPALCYTLVTTNMYEMTLNPYVSEARYTHEKKTFYHFCGLRNNRLSHMRQISCK